MARNLLAYTAMHITKHVPGPFKRSTSANGFEVKSGKTVRWYNAASSDHKAVGGVVSKFWCTRRALGIVEIVKSPTGSSAAPFFLFSNSIAFCALNASPSLVMYRRRL